MAFNTGTKLYNIPWNYVLTWILLIFSGNPVTRLGSQYVPIILSIILFIFFYKQLNKDFYLLIGGVVLALCFLFFCQKVVLGFISYPGCINYIMTFFFGGLLIYIIGKDFPIIFLNIVSYVSIISLAGYLIINIAGIHPPALAWSNERYTYILYTYVKQHSLRNCGMFWEPGAFAGIITLSAALNINELPTLWHKYKFRIIAIILALLTTQSTTGYFVLFIIGLYYLVFFVKNFIIKFSMIALMILIGIIVYQSTDFLKDKVESQSETSMELDKGEFSAGRFSAFIFDLHYIKKHPIVGNGLHESTRYADHPQLIQLMKFGFELAHGNGLSNYTASMGIPFMLTYLCLIYYAVYKYDSKIALIVMMVIILSLFSEQWLRYPLFTGLFFLRKKIFSYG